MRTDTGTAPEPALAPVQLEWPINAGSQAGPPEHESDPTVPEHETGSDSLELSRTDGKAELEPVICLALMAATIPVPLEEFETLCVLAVDALLACSSVVLATVWTAADTNGCPGADPEERTAATNQTSTPAPITPESDVEIDHSARATPRATVGANVRDATGASVPTHRAPTEATNVI